MQANRASAALIRVQYKLTLETGLGGAGCGAGIASSEAVVHGDALCGAAEPPGVPVARGVEAGAEVLAYKATRMEKLVRQWLEDAVPHAC